MIFSILGVLVILFQLANIGGSYHGLDSPFWGFLLGIGLICSPFKAISMLLYYLLMLVFIVGFPFLGAYIGVQFFGKDSFGTIIGLIIGGLIGFNIAINDLFDNLSSPFRKIASHDDK